MQILIIQTAFIGDVVLATSVAEKLHHHFPKASIDFCIRSGYEELFDQHPFVRSVHSFNKLHKGSSLIQLIKRFRSIHYDLVINLHRFLSSGILAAFSGADQIIGFRKNPLSFLFSERYPHSFDGQHEIERNHSLIAGIVDDPDPQIPKLYVDHLINKLKERYGKDYVTISPGSVWQTKKVPLNKWIELIRNKLSGNNIYLLGGADDLSDCQYIQNQCKGLSVMVLAGQLSMLESAALMKGADMNYVNDSAPMHFASAVNASVTAAFCSTIPAFGFAPLSDMSFIAETGEQLPCRPCGIHGKRQCPQGHFRCGSTIIL
ncbi:glycosyltransferase family 9 protein [Marinoscillum pacificum]|uniref:glycosyltransferase family 9 protein n=1 Tax=Marinoscillum pacificum TaxID=392723 RepID=UPI0021571BEF|nr:glycosyltransferase family 9 protein [Marinoscillum pacificum]